MIPTRPAGKSKVPPHRKPRRVQRRRHKGYRLPKTAVFVGRGTPYGNGWKIGEPDPETGAPLTRDQVVARYKASLAQAPAETVVRIRDLIGGYDLACFCREDQACHADVLLKVANGTPREVWDYLHPDDPTPDDEPDEPTEDDLIAMSMTMLDQEPEDLP